MEKLLNLSFNGVQIPSEFLVIGFLRESLRFRSREAMNRNWKAIFDDMLLPNDHEQVDAEVVFKFVTEISKPVRGRPGTITQAAQAMIQSFLKTSEHLDADFFQPNDVTEKVDFEQIYVFENIEQLGNENEAIPSFQDQPKVNDSDVSENLSKLILNKITSITTLDIVFSFTIAACCYGLATILKEMGGIVAIVYTLVSFHALGMAKNRYAQQTAKNGIIAVWLLECGAFFIHLTMFNTRLWESVNQMPFEVDPIGESRIFWIAFVVAVLFSAAGIYAVSTTLSLVSEKTEAENFENAHNQKY